jgi:hypothetical protein
MQNVPVVDDSDFYKYARKVHVINQKKEDFGKMGIHQRVRVFPDKFLNENSSLPLTNTNLIHGSVFY